MGLAAVYLLRQRALLHPVLPGHYLFCIQHGGGIIFVLVQFFVYRHGLADIGRLYDQQKLIAAHVAFHGVAPCIVRDFQQIRQDFHLYRPSGLGLQPPTDQLSGFLQLFWVGFSSLSEAGGLLLNL